MSICCNTRCGKPLNIYTDTVERCYAMHNLTMTPKRLLDDWRQFTELELLSWARIQNICKVPKQVLIALDIANEAEDAKLQIQILENKVRASRDAYYQNYWNAVEKIKAYMRKKIF